MSGVPAFARCFLSSLIGPISAGFAKASFLPLLDFAYTSKLTFNFCIMADIANLARHLLMTEVLQICESVHKQVEDHKLTVYQKGEVHTVVSSQPAPQEAMKDEPEAYVVTIESEDSEPVAYVTSSKDAFMQQPITVVTQSVEGEAVHTEEVAQMEPVALIAHSAHVEEAETVTLITGSADGMEGEAMTVVTHSGQAGASESLAVVSACLAMEQPQVAEEETYVISVDLEEANSSEGAKKTVSSQQQGEQQQEKQQEETVVMQKAEAEVEVEAVVVPPKRKRGRPAKVKKVVETEEMVPAEEVPSPDEGSSDKQESLSDDPRRRRLRQRSMAEGGYARLHMGLEEEEEKGSTLPRVTPPKVQKTPQNRDSVSMCEWQQVIHVTMCVFKVGPRHGKRGRPPKQPVQVDATDQAGSDSAADASEVQNDTAAEATAEEASTKESEPERAVKQLQAASEGAVDGEHTCSECGMSFQRRYSLIMHTLKHEKARGYKCSVSFLLNCGGAVVRLCSMLVSLQLCSKEFQYSASLQAHLARHKQHRSQWGAPAKVPAEHGSQGREDAEANDKTSASATKREFVCDICGKTLPKLYSLRIHMLSHTGVRPHSCKVCGKTFAHKPSLKMHRALHDSAKQFQCEFCSKTFMSKRSMEEHTSLHTGQSRHPSLLGSDDFNRQRGWRWESFVFKIPP